MRILFFLLSACILSVSIAQMVDVKEQSSFYLGKRVTLEANFVTNLSTSPQTPSETIDYDVHDLYNSGATNFYLHKKGEFKTSIGLTNKLGLYAKFAALKRSRETSETEFYYGDNNNFRGSYEYGQPLLKGTNIGLGASIFLKRKGSLAPIGTHINIVLVSR